MKPMKNYASSYGLRFCKWDRCFMWKESCVNTGHKSCQFLAAPQAGGDCFPLVLRGTWPLRNCLGSPYAEFWDFQDFKERNVGSAWCGAEWAWKNLVPPHRPSLRTQAPAPSPRVRGSCVYVGWGGILTGTSPPNCTPGSTGGCCLHIKN